MDSLNRMHLMLWKQSYVFITMMTLTFLSLMTHTVWAQSRLETQENAQSLSVSEKLTISEFWSDVAEYSNIAGNCYGDGDITLSDRVQIVEDPQLRRIIDEANRKANAPLPHPYTTYNMGTGTEVRGSSMNDAAGFRCELYKTSSGKYALGFAGTKMEFADIVNAIEGINKLKGQSSAAIEVAKDVVGILKEKGIPESDLILTGHSQGGREAQEASVATGIKAIVFNSADLSKETKKSISRNFETMKKVERNIVKISSSGDWLTNLQHNHPGLFGEEVISNQVTIHGIDNHSIKDLSIAVNERAFAEMVSILPKEHQDIFFSQYSDYKKDIEESNYDKFKWEMHQKMSHEMAHETSVSGGLHNLLGAINKESAEESLELSQQKMDALEDAVKADYKREVDSISPSIVRSDDETLDVLNKFVFDSSRESVNWVQLQGLTDFSFENNVNDISEGGHFLYGRIRVNIVIEPKSKAGMFELYMVEDCRYLLINNDDIPRVDTAFISSLSDLQPGKHRFTDTTTLRSREEIISIDTGHRGL